MIFTDRLTIDTPRRTADGFLVTRAKAARTGVYSYTGAEVDPNNEHGLRDEPSVNVLRDEATVFDKKSLHSFVGKPITNDHPHEAVTADNWRDHARGVVMGAVRDGEYVAFDLLLTDAAAIADVEAGKRELSNGYSATLEFGDFQAPDGTPCPVRQASVRGNHCAIVDRGRAGSDCRIADAASCSSLPADLFDFFADRQTYSGSEPSHKNVPTNNRLHDGEKLMHTLIIDGLQVTEVSDQAKAAIEKLQGNASALQDKLSAAEGKIGELTAAVSTKDGEIAALEQKVKDAAVTPEALEQMAADRAALIATAKAVDPNVVTDGKSDAEIRKAVVSSKLGDAAKDMADEAISGAFKVLTKDVKPADHKDALRSTIESGSVNVGDARTDYLNARDKARADISNAWRRTSTASEAAA